MKDENENETKEERDARRSVFRRRVSFAEHANIRVIQPSDDDPASPAISSSPHTPPPPMQSPRSPSRLSSVRQVACIVSRGYDAAGK